MHYKQDVVIKTEEEVLYRSRRKRSIVFYITHFIICELLFLSLFSVAYIYHGPFSKLRDYIVSTSMGTYKYRFFSTWFLSTGEINRILARTDSVVKDAVENTGNVTVAAKKTSVSGTANKPADSSATDTAISNTASTDTGITVVDVSGPNFKGKLMLIDDPSRIAAGLAPELGRTGSVLSRIVKYYNAVGGINAGGFTDVAGAVPDGIVIDNGKIMYSQGSRAAYGVIGFNYDNVLVISNKMSLDEIKRSNLRCALSFGPALIINGQPLVARGGTTLQPRSAIAQRKDGTILLLAIDGRQPSSKGVNLKTLQDVLLQYDAYNAANLDGGGSTTLDFNGKIINNPSDVTGERLIASAFLVMPPKK